MKRLNKHIKIKSFNVITILLIFSLSACSKGGDSPFPTPTPPVAVLTESDIAFKVDISGSEINYSNVFAVVGASIVINANITSTLPKDGVTVEVSVKKKLDNTVVYSKNIASSAASNPLTITGLVPGVLCVTTVTVTSKSKSSNTLTKTFEMASK